MAYRVIVLQSAGTDLEKLDPEIRRRILRRMVWLGENAANIVHHPLAGMPDALAGLCRFRVGDHRILYWLVREQETLKVYRIQHRSEIYRHL